MPTSSPSLLLAQVKKLRIQNARTVEEQAKRMAAEEASKTKNMFLSHMSHELYVLLRVGVRMFVCASMCVCVRVCVLCACVCLCVVW